ncbi:globin domain-containing protein [Cupriavidus sp. AU9028]|uniref:globin domain-containing protein n=1 Tax=Cupriavidus sp. AU9028 TaxID=2871157 RepID=UPI001C98675F|nr:flavohemoprotein [Cupriavidus sp. AU9028]
MLSDASKPLIDASVPVLRQHGLAITQLFYRNMFEERPELTNLFNMGNQANGSQQQSLAAAVFAYAANHRNAEALGPVLERIVHKHVSVGLKPSHYAIVGKHLLGAVKTTLGEAATPELMTAWDEAYWVLAGELIAAEARLYQSTNGGPDHRVPVRVVQRKQQSDDIVSFTLAPVGDGKLVDFAPGQYVSVVVELSPGKFQQRQYSLSDAPNGNTWRISVKVERGDAERPVGTVSNWLHRNADEGTVLMVSQPYGDFAPSIEGDTPVALLSAGVGITPMISALNTLAQRNPNRRVVFAHAARERSQVAHIEDVVAAVAKLPKLSTHYFLESGEPATIAGGKALPGRMAVERVLAEVGTDCDFYLCGPLPFMQVQRAALEGHGVAAHRIHREVFGPDLLDDIL